jgi:hypothetical protein
VHELIIDKNVTNFTSYMSDEKMAGGPEYKCIVECDINGVRYKVAFATIDPENAIQFAKSYFKMLRWEPK